MDRGYIKIWRKIQDEAWYTDPNTLSLAIFFLLKAAHKEKKIIWNRQEMIIKRGQLITGRDRLAIETGLTPMKVRLSLDILKNCNFVTSKTTNRFTLITICNYDIYQSQNTSNNQQNNQQDNQQITNRYPTDNHKQELKELRELKRIKNIHSEDVQQILDYLNEKTGKKFKNPGDLSARFKDGYTVEDAMKVIDNKLADSNFQELDGGRFMRPATLFCKSHFDDYLNEKPLTNKPAITISHAEDVPSGAPIPENFSDWKKDAKRDN